MIIFYICSVFNVLEEFFHPQEPLDIRRLYVQVLDFIDILVRNE